jgi:hypothetical protein
MDIETALLIVDDELPDGAYFAMLGELTGLPHDAVVEALVEHADRIEELASPPPRGKKGKR